VSNESLNSPGEVVSLDEISRRNPSGDGVRWSLQGGDDLNVNLAYLVPGSHVDTHTNYEVDVVVVVLGGNGQVSIDTIDHELAPHVLALAPRRSQRSISAGPVGLTYLTVHLRRGPLRIKPSTDHHS
jgi:mannose-6-phosphate isomerase-like protein (cupin superfamily)